MTIISVFAMLAEHLGVAYERRPQQEEVADMVASSLSNNITALIKAPTGVGKSYAYLIPAILEIQRSRGVDKDGFSTSKRVIVTTANTALQDQLFTKDLPDLHKAMGGGFTFAYLKGRERYICLNKADGVEIPGIREVLDRIEEMIGTEGFHGEFEQLDINVSDDLRRAVTSDEDSCEDCTDGCFYQENAEAAKAADILVVNHSLFVKDVEIRSLNPLARIIGTYHHVIVDEAHQLEEYGTSTLGDKISLRTIDYALKSVEKFLRMQPAYVQSSIGELINVVRGRASDFFNMLEGMGGGGNFSKRMKAEDINKTNLAELNNSLVELKKALTAGLINNVQQGHRGAAQKLLDRATRRVKLQAKRCKTIGTGPWFGDDGFVRILEFNNNRPELHFKPISMAGFMRKDFFGQGMSAVFISATLPFKYIASRLGVPENSTTLGVSTPFPLKECGLFFVPKEMPDPNGDRRVRAQAVADQIIQLVEASKGRALLLFTASEMMDLVYELASSQIKDMGFNVLKQSTKKIPTGQSNKALADTFRNDNSSVLFGMKSFMTGVDFQGDTCSLVVIDKMPYPNFKDPLIEARCDSITHVGGDKFRALMDPEMAIALDQAMGRLIRRMTDRGVVAVLDHRLRAQKYNWLFEELPPFRCVGGIKIVREFFNQA